MEFTSILSNFSALFKPSHLIKKKSYPFTVMIVSPHPDDECISGSLALRLAHENNAHIVNIAVTLGSNKDRQAERMRELEAACSHLEIESIILDDNWKTKEKELKSLLQKYQPQVIIAPHIKDHHPTHIKSGELLLKSLKGQKLGPMIVAWSEFWGANKKANLLLEVPEDILNLQMQGLSLHKGEVARNPYHLRLPAWMMDNVRRGAELLSGKGALAPNMAFAVLYQLQLFKKGKVGNMKLKKSVINNEENIAQIFKLILDAASGSKTKTK